MTQKSFSYFISESLFILNVTSVLVELSIFSNYYTRLQPKPTGCICFHVAMLTFEETGTTSTTPFLALENQNKSILID